MLVIIASHREQISDKKSGERCRVVNNIHSINRFHGLCGFIRHEKKYILGTNNQESHNINGWSKM